MTSRFLRVYGNRRVMSLLGLGFSSGLPLPLTSSTLQAWMALEKVDLSVIGLYSLVGLPYTVKVLWAPLLDRYAVPWLGRRRGWILVSQLFLAVGLAVLGSSSPQHMPWVLAALAMSVAFLSASQDIVVDAYRAEVLRSEELGAGAAATVTGYRMALMASGAVALILSDRLPWHLVYGIMAALMLASACFTLFAPEPAERVTPPQSVTEAIWKPLVDFFARSGAISMLGFIMLFKLGDAIAAAMVTPFLLDLGFTRTDVGAVNKAFGLVTTLAGTVAGGGIIAHIGINRSLWVFAWLQALSNLAFSGLAVLGRSYAGLVAAVGIENLCGGMGTAAFVAFLMSLCNKRFTATQYALLSSLMAVARVLAGVPSGLLAAKLGWPLFFLVSALGALPGMALLPRFAPWRMR